MTYPNDLYCLNAFLLVLVNSLPNEFFFAELFCCFFFFIFSPPDDEASPDSHLTWNNVQQSTESCCGIIIIIIKITHEVHMENIFKFIKINYHNIDLYKFSTLKCNKMFPRSKTEKADIVQFYINSHKYFVCLLVMVWISFGR